MSSLSLLTVEALCSEAHEFALIESTYPENSGFLLITFDSFGRGEPRQVPHMNPVSPLLA